MTSTASQSGFGPCTLRLLPNESQAEFDAFACSVWEHYQPASAYEQMLTNFVVITSWRYRRFLSIEESIIAEEAMIAAKRPSARQDSSSDGSSVLSSLVKDKESSQSIKLVLRHVAAARRDMNNAITNLQRVQKDRLAVLTTEADQGEARTAIPPVTAAQPAVETNDHAVGVEQRTPSRDVVTLSRAERRALERKLRKAERKALRLSAATGEGGFVSQAA